MISQIANAMDQLAETVESFAQTFSDAVNSAFLGLKPIRQGKKAKAHTERTGSIYGHICEYRTDETVTIARKSDGVLVHVHRDSLVWVTDR